MEFPITGVTINPLLLAGIGFLVGILGGFFGVISLQIGRAHV